MENEQLLKEGILDNLLPSILKEGQEGKKTKKKDMVGQRFGRLTVTEEAPRQNTGNGVARWTCVCDCGKVIVVRGDTLRSGLQKSCGCLRGGKRNTAGRPKGSLNKNSANSRHAVIKSVSLSIEDWETLKALGEKEVPAITATKYAQKVLQEHIVLVKCNQTA